MSPIMVSVSGSDDANARGSVSEEVAAVDSCLFTFVSVTVSRIF